MPNLRMKANNKLSRFLRFEGKLLIFTVLLILFVGCISWKTFFRTPINSEIRRDFLIEDISKNLQINQTKLAQFDTTQLEIISRLDLNGLIALQQFPEATNRVYKELKEKEQELVQAEKMAALGTISAGMAHEINNPLMGIMLLVQNLTSQKREEKEQKALSFIDNGLKRIEGVVSKLLAFSRKEKLILRKENINNIIEETIPFISHEFVSNDIELVKDYRRDLPDLELSSNAMQQAFMNILLNAKDSVLDSGFKKITITTYMENDAVKIKFKDEGIGMKKEDLKKVFDPFFTTKAVGKGLGMGMSIVRNIIEQHGGKININSEPRKGTEVIISLPVPA